VELSVGTALVDASQDESIESLIGRADAEMYEEKRGNRTR
jgi:PleD family two-component response regulator